MVGQSPSARINLPLPPPHNMLPTPQVKHMHSPKYRFCLYDTQLRVYIPQVPLVHMSLRDTCVPRTRGCTYEKGSFFVHETLWMYKHLCPSVKMWNLHYAFDHHSTQIVGRNVHEYICDKCDTSSSSECELGGGRMCPGSLSPTLPTPPFLFPAFPL